MRLNWLPILMVLVASSSCIAEPAMQGAQQLPATTAQENSFDAVVANAAIAFFEDAPAPVGLSVAVVRGSEISTYHFGTTQIGGTERPNDRTIYPIASLTKTVTGSLLALAEVEGRLSLTDDIRDYLDGPFPNLERDGRHIQIAHLVNHLSGLPRSLPDHPAMLHTHPSYGGDPIPWAAYVEGVLADYDDSDFLSDLRNVVLPTVPGAAYSYSNAATQIAGLILQQVYAQPFEDVVESRIVRPLGLVDTGFSLSTSQARRLAVGYDDQGRVMPRDLSARGTAGGLFSTIVDLARYAAWHLDESDAAVYVSHTTTAGFTEVEGQALNWIVEPTASGVRRIAGDGTVPGFNSRMILFPELDLGVVVLVNQLDATSFGLTNRLANQILGAIDSRTW